MVTAWNNVQHFEFKRKFEPLMLFEKTTALLNFQYSLILSVVFSEYGYFQNQPTFASNLGVLSIYLFIY